MPTPPCPSYGHQYGQTAPYGAGTCPSGCIGDTYITGIAEGLGPWDNRGGQAITLQGSFPANGLEVFCGQTGDDTDAPCYGGQGYGYLPQSLDGSTLSIVLPPLDGVGADFYLTTRSLGTLQCPFGPITVTQRNFKPKEQGVHRSFPRWMALFDDEVA